MDFNKEMWNRINQHKNVLNAIEMTTSQKYKQGDQNIEEGIKKLMQEWQEIKANIVQETALLEGILQTINYNMEEVIAICEAPKNRLETKPKDEP